MNGLARTLLLLSLSLMTINVVAQDYPVDYFDSPVERRIYLSGTFGELRPGHFHAGIDIKPLDGKAGEKVFTAAGGYISRIAVSPGGYGNALYIAHPNGYTTVYAHLDRFIPEVAAYVKKKQYEGRKFRVNLYPPPNQFVLNRGDLIGYLGISGNSFGPHLHFEVRRTADQVPVNPFHFGFEVIDNLPPEITHLRLYYMDVDHNILDTKDYMPIEIQNGEYIIPDTLTEGAWRIGLSVKSQDIMDGINNRLGAYMVDMEVDGTSQFAFEMNAVSFAKSRYINAHIDYGAAADDLGRMHRCYKLEGNALNMYDQGPDLGYISLYEQNPRHVKIKVSDFSGNISTLEFDVLRSSEMIEPSQGSGEKCLPNGALTIDGSGFEISFPAGSVYAPTYFEYSSVSVADQTWVGPLHTIGSKHIPLHKYCEITMDASAVPKGLESKAFIARQPDNKEDEIRSYGGSFSNGKISTGTRDCGTYGIRLDTVPPLITPVKFSDQMSESTFMRFKITDNVETSGRARSLQINASVDGKWILMEYDAKNDVITHWFDERIKPGKHNLRITVSDDRLNSTIFEKTFTR